MGAIADMLALLGIAAQRHRPLGPGRARDRRLDRGAVRWSTVVLECHRPDGTVRPIFEFPVTYEIAGEGAIRELAGGDGARPREDQPGALGHHLQARLRLPHGPSRHNGWSPATRASTDGLRSTSFGSLAEAPHARASLRYLR